MTLNSSHFATLLIPSQSNPFSCWGSTVTRQLKGKEQHGRIYGLLGIVGSGAPSLNIHPWNMRFYTSAAQVENQRVQLTSNDIMHLPAGVIHRDLVKSPQAKLPIWVANAPDKAVREPILSSGDKRAIASRPTRLLTSLKRQQGTDVRQCKVLHNFKLIRRLPLIEIAAIFAFNLATFVLIKQAGNLYTDLDSQREILLIGQSRGSGGGSAVPINIGFHLLANGTGVQTPSSSTSRNSLQVDSQSPHYVRRQAKSSYSGAIADVTRGDSGCPEIPSSNDHLKGCLGCRLDHGGKQAKAGSREGVICQGTREKI